MKNHTRMWSVLFLATALAVVGGLAYAGWDWVSSPRPSDEPVSERAFPQACPWPRTYFPDAAAYAGEPPHPVVIEKEVELNVGKPSWHPMLLASTPELRVPHHVNPEHPKTVQLVACVDRTDEGDQIDMCQFESSSAPVHRADYTVTLYEAKTGTTVGDTTIRDAERFSCPLVITWESGEDPKVFAAPSPRQVLQAITAIQN